VAQWDLDTIAAYGKRRLKSAVGYPGLLDPADDLIEGAVG
jgi:hypothetical protein